MDGQYENESVLDSEESERAMGVRLIKREHTYHIFARSPFNPPSAPPVSLTLFHVRLCDFHVERRSSFLYSHCMPPCCWVAPSSHNVYIEQEQGISVPGLI